MFAELYNGSSVISRHGFVYYICKSILRTFEYSEVYYTILKIIK